MPRPNRLWKSGSMKPAIKHLGFAALALIAGCSPGAADAGTKTAAEAAAPAVHPVSGLQIVPVTVTGTSGRHVFRSELARTSAEQAKGLMFRTELGDEEGMIFLRNPPDMATFWMRNTVIPLDIIYIGPDHKISNIGAMAEPYSLDPIYSVGPVLGVLELRGGLAAELGIEPGDRVDW